MVRVMKTRVTILCGLALVLASAVQAQTPNAPQPAQWQRYTIKGEEFSITLPALPALRTKQGSRLNKTRLERTLTTSANGVLYAVYSYENPTPRQSLADFIGEQTSNYRSELILERAVEVNGFVGKEYKSLDKSRPAIEQFFATDEHLYRFMVFGVSTDNAGVKQFFASIALGKKPEGIDVSEGPNPSRTDTGEEIYSTKDVDVKARITRFFPPEYTEDARRHRVTGVVILKAVLSANGVVTDVEVISGLPHGLSEKAIEAAKKLKFVPAIKDGKPVATWMQMEYNFNLY
jgi:TonB family protein